MLDDLQLELDKPIRGKTRLTTLLVMFIAWAIFVTGYPALNDSLFYHVDQPVEVVSVGDDYVRLRFVRHTLWGMAGVCSNELHCDSVQELPPTGCPLEAGSGTFDAQLPFLEIATNGGGGMASCIYRGTVQYAPFGTVFGPVITHSWSSEPFDVPRGK